MNYGNSKDKTIKTGRMPAKVLAALLAALVMAFCLTACGGQDQDSGSGEGAGAAAEKAIEDNTLIYGSNDYTRINPAIDEHGEINLLLFDGLMGHDKDNNVVPALAKSYDLDKKTNTYTFHLRKGVKWHDGEDFTAKDVKFTIDAIMDPDNESEIFSNYEDVEKITVKDDYTVAFKLKAPNVAFL